MHNTSTNVGAAAPLALCTLLASCLFFSAGCATTTEPASPAAPASVASLDDVTIQAGDVVSLTVWGMSCPKCVNNVDQLLRDVPGVESTATDMSNGIVTVQTGSPAPQTTELKAAVEQAGFTLMDMSVAGGQQ